MTDRELLELAARAAGYVVEWREWVGMPWWTTMMCAKDEEQAATLATISMPFVMKMHLERS